MANLQQGDTRLIHSAMAQQLLAAPELARVAYVATDGTPRVIPMGYVWNGTQLVLSTFATSAKIRALRARPDVAVTIDRAGPPPEVLLIRGRVTIEEVIGAPAEYREMQTRYYGAEQADAVVAAIDRAGARMGRIMLEPSWVATLDFQSRFPRGLVDAGLAG